MLSLFAEVLCASNYSSINKVVTTSGVIGHHGLRGEQAEKQPIGGGDLVWQPMGEQGVHVLSHSANIGQVN